MEIANDYQALPDIITAINDETLLTPATVNRILVESGRCGDFLNNPEAFLEQAIELIRSHRVYDYVIYDSSTVEKSVAVALNNAPDVKMFFKIPSRFKIETPIGIYNPDLAVYLSNNG